MNYCYYAFVCLICVHVSRYRSEQVILVQGLTIAFDKPVVIEAIHSTAQTLEPYLQTKRIYLAPHTLMKYSVGE